MALALIELLLAYEWLSSALTKLVRGDFPARLGAELRGREHGSYGTLLRHVVVPHAAAFGWAIELGELLVALLLLAAAASALAGRRPRLGRSAAVVGALAGAFLTVNFGLSRGERFFRLIGGDSFDEGVPLDVLATWLQVALVAGVAATLRPGARRAA